MKIKLQEVQQLERGVLNVGYKVTCTDVAKNYIKSKIIHTDLIYGDNILNEMFVVSEEDYNRNLETEWLTAEECGVDTTQWHKDYNYDSVEQFEKAEWIYKPMKTFIWDCEDEIEEE